MADKKPPPEGVTIISENRRVHMRYTIDERIEVGIELMGSEVKSLRGGKMELNDAYAHVQNGQLTLLNAYIPPYPFATMVKHEEKRSRRLLAHRSEIDHLEGKTKQRGFTLVVTRAYFKEGRVKIELGLARGKDNADRREDIKKRDVEREMRASLVRRNKA